MSSNLKSIQPLLRYFFIPALAALTSLSCKKQTVYEGQPATLSVFNGLDDGILLYGNYSGSQPTTYKYSQTIRNGFLATTGYEESSIHARYFASPDTLSKDKPVFDQQLQLEKSTSYSLYLAGGRSSVDYLLVENKFIDYTEGDSLTYLQIVNVSNDQPVSVNIQGQANGSLIGSLPYKSASQFLTLNADHMHPVYTFEFRDAATGELLYTAEVPYITGTPDGSNGFLYKNWTFVFKGKRGATDINAINVFKIFYQFN
jgi:hypothetical protein